ncbi:CLUMA_CG005631, isoform A [Clunio marinus]|uniref:CLUMA_CG005631, isoform A n=1 Tax=Clunio marinus TaxID=568069 RepID=A0A1J1HVP3_9DIPT|nr:CLUMA_CG005631, isoform A [Clunio marinus]
MIQSIQAYVACIQCEDQDISEIQCDENWISLLSIKTYSASILNENTEVLASRCESLTELNKHRNSTPTNNNKVSSRQSVSLYRRNIDIISQST